MQLTQDPWRACLDTCLKETTKCVSWTSAFRNVMFSQRSAIHAALKETRIEWHTLWHVK